MESKSPVLVYMDRGQSVGRFGYSIVGRVERGLDPRSKSKSVRTMMTETILSGCDGGRTFNDEDSGYDHEKARSTNKGVWRGRVWKYAQLILCLSRPGIYGGQLPLAR